ncbi:MAG: hypothetical protein KDB14_12740 [Planctomycetales bacterium]|nr:hypothetical protein [Planctomycetales bacterium]
MPTFPACSRILLAGLVLLLAPAAIGAQEIGFWEEFALAEDREAALRQLIPGTEDYYYFHALHYQNTERFEQSAEMLKLWGERHGRTARLREIATRQSLLTYPRDRAASLEFVRSELNLHFGHQREVAGEKPNLPTRLDPALIQRERLSQLAHQHNDLRGFESTALPWLASTDLNPDKRRLLLQQLDRPDLPNLVDLVDADLKHPRSGGFGSLNIHRLMLRSQLDELARRQPQLLSQSAFVRTYLTRLAPTDDEDWQYDDDVKLSHLDRLWGFVAKLGPVHNSLKAHVLYRRLALDRIRGEFNRDRFDEYLRLPRSVPYVNPDYLKVDERRRYMCNLGEQYPESGLPPVGNDESLVRQYLLHFFVKDDNYDRYLPLIRTEYLKQAFAESKVTAGVGNPEQWASLLPPSAFQALKDRVDLDFAPGNRRLFGAEANVSLDLDIKHVDTLLVNIFRINTETFYRANASVVNTDIALDGLVPNWQRQIKYTDPPLHRKRRHFDFPELSQPGVYVIDFVGNGKNSRAVVQKGQLRAIAETAPDGQLLNIVDADHQPVKNASVLLGGKVYAPDKQGAVLVPFATQPGTKPIVILRGEEAYLDQLQHRGEQYSLSAGIYIDKESLLARRRGRVVLRPRLSLDGTPISIEELKDTSLELQSVDLDGIASTQHVPGIVLHDHREAEHEFLVPPRTAKLTVTLRGEVKPISRTGEPVKLEASQEVIVNSFDATELVADLHLTWRDSRYALLLLGRTGEPLPDRAVRVRLKHRDFTALVDANLKTDGAGAIELGALPEIDRIDAEGLGAARSWPLSGDNATIPDSVHGFAGQEIQLPLPAPLKLTADGVSLLETRSGQFVADQFERLQVRGGLLVVRDLPAGDYDLLFKQPVRRRVHVRVTNGPRHAGHALGQTRYLELRGQRPLAVSGVVAKDGKLTVSLQNATKMTRVHLLASRIVPEFSAFSALGAIRDLNPSLVSIARRSSLYAEGRKIGEEYRYILERQLATKFPGNMLERPSLLLNPWALRTTSVDIQDPQGGAEFKPSATEDEPGVGRKPATSMGGAAARFAANLDFFAAPGAVVLNFAPDDKGQVQIDLDALGDAQHVRIIAADGGSVIQRQVSLEPRNWGMLDLRMANGLKPDSHFIQRQAISTLEDGKTLRLSAGATRVRTYDSLRSMYQLMSTLNSDERMADFRFLLDWPTLKAEEKRAKYSEFACHELNFFLAQKDPQFFEEVVAPYLANKHHRTFLDRYLLDEDPAAFLDAWRHSQLNAVERILIGHRLPNQSALVQRHIRELFELLPPDPARSVQLFSFSLANQVMDAIDGAAPADEYAGDFNGNAPGFAPGYAYPAPANLLKIAESDLQQNKDKSEQVVELERMLKKSNDKVIRMQAANGQQALQSLKELAESNQQGQQDRFYRKRALAGKLAEQLYQPVDKTMEWAENNYYRRPIESQNSELVKVNAFWLDYAKRDPQQPFLSRHFAEAATNATESLMALAVLDLPFAAKEHQREFEDEELSITAGSRMIVLHEELLPGELPEGPSVLLVSQNFYQQGDRYRHENGVQLDKYVTDEFLTHTVYGCQLVITNPTSTPRQLEVLFQLPVGAIAVQSGKRTESTPVQLGPYQTTTLERLFYFPQTGKYSHFPVHVSQQGELLAAAEPFEFNVVESLTRIDRTSWDYVSQNGTNEDVLQYLQDHNLQRTPLHRIAFRMRDKAFFERVIQLLADNRAYDRTLWSYAVHHDQPERIDELLRHEDGFVAQCGPYLDSPLLHLDPIERRTYQHLDYRPLINARSHQLSATRQILNNRLHAQYHELLKILACRSELSDAERMAVTYYMLVQDRVELALQHFAAVNRENLATKIQHDYFTAYTAFYREDLATALEMAERHANHPVDRWRNAFAVVKSQIDEINGAKASVIDDLSRDQRQGQLAANSPALDVRIEGREVRVDYQNVEELDVRYYLMDVELLYSRQPFVQRQDGNQFSYIQPNDSRRFKLPANKSVLTFQLPESLRNRNVLVEFRAGGVLKTLAHLSNSMNVQMVERYGSLRVANLEGKPLPKVYVKVYARHHNGEVKFYKDGYTDLRGQFDYASLSTSQLEQVERFALLILSDEAGAKVLEASPPTR